MLGWRLGLSAILIPLLGLIFWLDHRSGAAAPWLFGFCVLLAVRSCWEMTHLLTARAFQPRWWLGSLGSLSCLLAVWLPGWLHGGDVSLWERLGPLGLSYALTVLVIFLVGLVCYERNRPGQNMETLGAELLTVSYVGVLLGTTAQLRWVAGADAGYLVLASLIIAAKLGDVGGYTLGRLFGKAKLVPRLSPGKTRVGGLGALLGGSLGAWLWLTFATPQFNPAWQPPAWYWSVLYGLTLGFVGLVGDLAESYVKRDMQKKDAANLMPGFGGLLDLLDSVLYAGPVALVLWQLLPLATWR